MRSSIMFAMLTACGAAAPAVPDGAVAGADAAAPVDAAVPVPDAAPCVPAHVLYLNRNTGGTTYRPGNDDARANTSSLLSGTRIAPAWPGASWDAIVTCVRGALAPYDVAVVDVDPGNVVHQEISFTTSPTVIGLPNGTGAVGPFSCGVIPTGIGFVFELDPDPLAACADANFVYGVMQGLERVTDCGDYLSNCGDPAAKAWVDADVACENNACQCGGTGQNHAAGLVAAVGAHCS